MNKIIFAIALLVLSACSTQVIKQASNNASVENVSVHKTTTSAALSKKKGNKLLKLIRVMEGGACKNAKQGVTGMFMFYAYPDDVERIKKSQGTSVFTKFEQSISEFSAIALQQAINNTEFSQFVFIPDEAGQKKTTKQLIQKFSAYIAPAIRQFENETTLTIAVEASVKSLHFYLDGCDIPHAH